MSGKCDWSVAIGDSHTGYTCKSNENQPVLTLHIPWGLLKECHTQSQNNVEFVWVDYINPLIKGVPGVLNKDSLRLEEQLKKKGGTVVRELRKCKLSSRKRNDMLVKLYYFHVFEGETNKPSVMLDEILYVRNDEFQKWRISETNLNHQVSLLSKEIVRLITCKNKVTDDMNILKDKINSLESVVGNECRGEKNFIDLSRCQKSNRLRDITLKAEKALWFIDTFGLEIKSLKLADRIGKSYTILDSLDTLGEDSKQIECVLFLMDRFGISDECYGELTQIETNLPRLGKVKQLRSQLNSKLNLSQTPGPAPGAMRSFVEALKEDIILYAKKVDTHPTEINFKVKVSGDGARITRVTSFLLLSFGLLNNHDDITSSKGYTTVGCVNGKESYAVVKECFGPVFEEINEVARNGFIEIEDQLVSVELFFGADYKFLLLTLGLSAATSNYACLWCHVSKEQRSETSHPIGYWDSKDRCRTIEGIQEHAEKNQFCVKNSPLITISLQYVVVDELHLMLRITDVLLRSAIEEVLMLDAKQALDKDRNTRIQRSRRDMFVQAVRDCGVSFDIWEKTDVNTRAGTGKFDWTSLMGDERKKLLLLLPDKLGDILHQETSDVVVKLWKDFHTLYKKIREDAPDHIDVFLSARDWVNLFLSLGDKCMGYKKLVITPYIHVMMYHLPGMIQRFGNIRTFTGQGVEKKNDDAKKAHFRKSNKWDGPVDMIRYENRLKLLSNAATIKRKYRKRKHFYWTTGIVESRSKRIRICNRQILKENTLSQAICYDRFSLKELKNDLLQSGYDGKIPRKKVDIIKILKSMA